MSLNEKLNEKSKINMKKETLYLILSKYNRLFTFDELEGNLFDLGNGYCIVTFALRVKIFDRTIMNKMDYVEPMVSFSSKTNIQKFYEKNKNIFDKLIKYCDNYMIIIDIYMSQLKLYGNPNKFNEHKEINILKDDIRKKIDKIAHYIDKL